MDRAWIYSKLKRLLLQSHQKHRIKESALKTYEERRRHWFSRLQAWMRYTHNSSCRWELCQQIIYELTPWWKLSFLKKINHFYWLVIIDLLEDILKFSTSFHYPGEFKDCHPDNMLMYIYNHELTIRFIWWILARNVNLLQE